MKSRRKIKRVLRRTKRAVKKGWNDPATQAYIKKQKKLLKDTFRKALRKIEKDVDRKLR